MATPKVQNRESAPQGKRSRVPGMQERAAALEDAVPGRGFAGHRVGAGGRIPQLDGIRGLAVLMVFAGHAHRTKLLWSGVHLFFLLSGFLITSILVEQRGRHPLRGYLARFYGRRARRILPPYILLLWLFSLFFGIGWVRHWYLFLFLMNTQSFLRFVSHYPMGMLWSLAVEEQFYLIWPLIVYFLSEKALAWLAALLVLTAPLLRFMATAVFPTPFDMVYVSTLCQMDLLAAGALIALGWRHYRALIERAGNYFFAVACAVGGSLIFLSRFAWFQPTAGTVASNVWLYEMILIAYAGLLLWALCGRGVQVLRWMPLRYMGWISYTFYLVHMMALALVRRSVHHYAVGNAIGFVVAFLFAAVSWHFMEHPILAARAGDRSPAKRWSEQPERAAL